jgi:hypothetical protein
LTGVTGVDGDDVDDVDDVDGAGEADDDGAAGRTPVEPSAGATSTGTLLGSFAPPEASAEGTGGVRVGAGRCSITGRATAGETGDRGGLSWRSPSRALPVSRFVPEDCRPRGGVLMKLSCGVMTGESGTRPWH